MTPSEKLIWAAVFGAEFQSSMPSPRSGLGYECAVQAASLATRAVKEARDVHIFLSDDDCGEPFAVDLAEMMASEPAPEPEPESGHRYECKCGESVVVVTDDGQSWAGPVFSWWDRPGVRAFRCTKCHSNIALPSPTPQGPSSVTVGEKEPL